MKKLFSVLIAVIFVYAVILLFRHSSAYAQSYYYKNVDVEVTLNQDSSFKVKETFTLNFTGEFHRVYREITLENRTNLEKCRNDATLQCGGFEFIKINNVAGEGRQLQPSEYKLSEVTVASEDRLKIEWEFSSNGRNFSNNDFQWSVEYTVYGGIGYFDDYDLFYWNAIFPDRTVDIHHAKVKVNFPESVDLKTEEYKVLGTNASFKKIDDKSVEFSNDINQGIIDENILFDRLLPYQDFTVLIQIPKDMIKKYSAIKLNTDPKTLDVGIDDDIFLEDKTTELKGIVPGKHTFIFSKSGYYKQEITLDLASGETKEVNVELKKTPLQQILEIIIIVCNLAACPIFIVIVWFAYHLYKTKGKDAPFDKAVVPWFKPPDDISPALLGSLKDEKVDMRDITSTVINVAYKGYIKIKELEKKDYELIKLKPFDDLDKIENKIMIAIMGANESMKISSLKNSFYKKVPSIHDAIYQEMVDKGYFTKRPDSVRKQYLGIAVAIIVLGSIASFSLPAVGIFLLGPALVIAGIVSLPFAYGMPAKTALGSEILNQVKGFQMYLHTAERFRLQNLTPETFEKFLSYAVVFGIEKEWADKFKDIYKTPPDWYEGRDMSHFNALYLANSLGSMQSNVSSTLSSTPSSSGSGWSGGGGFSGGFSGGGGGGGGGGAS